MKLFKTFKSTNEFVSIYVSDLNELFIATSPPRFSIRKVWMTQDATQYVKYLLKQRYKETKDYIVDASGQLHKTA